MGRKSTKRLQLKPFCYFCNREFDEEKVLIMHQKAKHFKCGECNRKLETANGLAVHMQQVHKLIQRKVPCALEGRDNINSVVQGMQGVPIEAIEEHHLKHQKKMGDIDTRKQQRISWSIVAMAPTPEQFLAQLSIGNIYFPGFTAPQEKQPIIRRNIPQIHLGQVPTYPPDILTGQPQPGMYPNSNLPTYGNPPAGLPGTNMRGRMFTAAPENVVQPQVEPAKNVGLGFTGSGPLILGPSGTPIEAPHGHTFNHVQALPRPTGISSDGNLTGRQGFTSAPKGFSNGPVAATVNPTTRTGFSGPTGFQKQGGFSDANTFPKTTGFSDAKPVGSTTGFSDASTTAKNSGFSAPLEKQKRASFDNPQPTSNKKPEIRGFSDAIPKTSHASVNRESDVKADVTHRPEESRIVKRPAMQTQYYKATGVPPLFIPPPSLGTTKLAYDVDTESIEEKRAKMLHNWVDIK
uniref:Zinc finger protein 207 n=1 Tax=Babesia bovis TaxID=5865 RepID=S6B6B2_BABBO|nr:zinc finger protein 207 [Babesia bovis]